MKSARILLDNRRVCLMAKPTLLALGLVLGSMGLAWAEGDAFMGDWHGERVFADGAKSPMVAQVIPLGDGQYRANLLDEFDKRITPIVALEGQLSGSKVVFTGREWTGTIEGEAFTGNSMGAQAGTFSMKKVVRLSPTLGAKPPEGAIVLFDGTNTDEWEHPDVRPWAIDLKRTFGGQNCVAYLRTNVWSRQALVAQLGLGSDDGIKAWLNGELVHANNVSRGVQPDADKVKVALNKGLNTLMLKVTQGSGDWGACARFRTADGGQLKGIHAGPQPSEKDAVLVGRDNGFILDWEVSGPYAEAGKEREALFDIAFAPEKGKGRRAEWRALSQRGPVDKTCRWKLVEDGAMEVFRGSLVSKKKFGDHKLHIEFMTPLMAKARGQARANSGVYLQERYEVQVLDSYGLEGRDNECGGIYKIAAPAVNMCAPPLQWQTYDITFYAAQVDAAGKVVKNARMTVVHNGVTILDDLELAGTTAGGINYDLSKPGGIYLQDHGNLVRFRNIWVEEL